MSHSYSCFKGGFKADCPIPACLKATFARRHNDSLVCGARQRGSNRVGVQMGLGRSPAGRWQPMRMRLNCLVNRFDETRVANRE
ncbi:unnamed protein product [Protopolystoma xenopodis]|uniref:Uncharacterized protein n=1 Tax=Protopolystoma xenopodis TaxID=117903 RepID=A0A448XPY7_9PLAT|nr:unnamed protein product [Protopolystoma xenopodis]